MTAQARPVASDDADALLGRLGQYFDHIVLDLGAASPQLALQVLQGNPLLSECEGKA